MRRALSERRIAVNRLVKPVVQPVLLILAGIYFLVDAIFMTLAKPLGDWIAKCALFSGLKAWIVSLRPYPTLALFLVPLIILEPVKPVAAYLAATGHVIISLAVLATGEMLKLVLVERLFSLSRDKLLSIAGFAWAYGKYRICREWLEATRAWQTARRFTLIVRNACRGFVLRLKASGLKVSGPRVSSKRVPLLRYGRRRQVETVR